MIEGELVALGPHRRDLLPTYQRWVNDLGTLRTLGLAPLPMTLEQETGWFERAATKEQQPAFTIYERATWRPVGTTALMDVGFRDRCAEFGIMIGEPDARGRGLGTETARLMLDYAFAALGLHNVMLRVFEYNLAGRRAYETAGFREFGRRRQAHHMGGRLWDVVYMESLASEFTSPVLARILAPDQPR
jgi:RimJ/RimL family protein N-acetyltransferase